MLKNHSTITQMNTKRFVSIFFLFLLTLTLTPDVSAQKALLRLTLNQDQVFSYVSTVDQVITQDIMGMNQVIKQKIALYYDLTVKDVSDETYTLDYTYTRVTLNMDGGAMLGVTEYDSDQDKEDTPPMAVGYAGMVGQAFTFTTNRRGEIQDVQGIDKLLDRMIEGMDDISEAEREAMKAAFRNQFGEEATKSNIQGSLPVFPEKKVKSGKSWDQVTIIAAGFQMNQTTTYTVESIAEDQVKLSASISQGSDPESTMETNGMTMAYEVTGQGTGESIIDMSSGMVSLSTSTYEISGEVTASGAMMGNGMTWPISISQTSVLEMTK